MKIRGTGSTFPSFLLSAVIVILESNMESTSFIKNIVLNLSNLYISALFFSSKKNIGTILYKLLLLIIPLCLLFSCNEDPHQLIVNIYNEELPGVVKDTTLFVMQDTSYFKKSDVNTRFSLRLGLGKVEDIECRPIFRFTDYTAIPDSAQIDSAWVKLVSSGSINEGSTLPFTARMHPIFSTQFSPW